ncbi:MAG: DNA polymerase III subunit gamma/tau [Rhodoferax sp.]
MSYLVLARKYRPRSFAEMVGQDHVVQALTNALTSGRLHHAYLFTGTRGVGKTTVSRILAKSLNCLGADGLGGVTAQPCGVCQACTDIDSGRFVDYTELDAASNRGVDEVQTLLEQAVYKPVQGRFKVFMIDEVHMLTHTAFNAMLKTLEEPPEYLKFVLATTDPQKVPVTVLSRCLQFNLRPMAAQTIREHLQTVLAAEQVGFDTPALNLLARAARGSMRDALSLTDQAIAFGAGALTEAQVRQMLGSADRSHVLRLIDALARADGRTVVETVEALRRQGVSADATLDDLTRVLQRMAVAQLAPDAPADDTDPDAPEIARLARQLPPDETQLLYSLCLHGRTELGLAPDDDAALTMVLLRLLAFKPAQSAGAGGAAGGAPSAETEKKTLNTAPEPVASARRPAESAVSEPPSAQSAPPVPAPAMAPSAVAQTAPEKFEENKPLAQSQTAVAAPEKEASATPTQALQRAPGVATLAAPAPAAPSTPVLHALPVRQAPPRTPSPGVPSGVGPASELDEHNLALAQEWYALQAPEIEAIPVREAPPSLREPPPAARVLQPTESGDFWHATVQSLIAAEAITAMARELALQSQLVARDADQWLLRIERAALNQPSSRERLTRALNDAGHAVSLAIEVGRVTDSPALHKAAAAEQARLAAEQIVLQDPLVQRLMREFGAKIVPGSIQPLPDAPA